MQVQAELNETNELTGRVPFMSANVAEFVARTIREGDFDVIVEYGSGGSTSYYLNAAKESSKPVLFTSVEMSPEWYQKTLEQVRDVYRGHGLSGEHFVKTPWSDEKIERYYAHPGADAWEYDDSLRRHPRCQEILRQCVTANVPGVPSFPEFLFSQNRPTDASYFGRLHGNLSWAYFLRTEILNDQYGESPNKQEYIDAGLRWTVAERLKNGEQLKALFIVDGGPRNDVIHSILDVEDEHPNLKLTVVQHDGRRNSAGSPYGRRSDSYFIAGTNVTLAGQTVFESEEASPTPTDSWIIFGANRATSAEEKSGRELWVYESQ